MKKGAFGRLFLAKFALRAKLTFGQLNYFVAK